MGDSFLFAVYVHHDGKFVTLEGSSVYVGGECEGFYHLDPDKFGYFDAAELVEKLGYVSWDKIWFKIPKTESYRVLKNDQDVMQMLSFLTPKGRVLHFYVEGCKRDENGRKSEAVNMSNVEGGSGLKGDKVGVEKDQENLSNVEGGSGLKDDNFGLENEQADDISNLDDLVDNFVTSKGEKKYGLDGYDSEYAEDEFDGEDEFDDENSDDSDFKPGHGEESDDELDDSELASDDEEYVKARQKVKTKTDIFDLVDEIPQNGLGFNQVFEHGEEVYASSEGEVCSDSTDEEGEGVRNKKFRSSYDPRTKPRKLEIKLGMRFEDGYQCKKALRDNAIAHGIYIKFEKVSKTVCQARCRASCKWRLYASLVQADDYFCVKTYYPTHKCRRKTNNKLMSSAWIAEHYMNVFRVHPNLPIKILGLHLVPCPHHKAL